MISMTSLFEMKMEFHPAECPGCGNQCEKALFGKGVRFFCDSCALDEKQRMRDESRRIECLAMAQAVIPAIYRETLKPELVCRDYLPALDLNPAKSFALVGQSNTGKTRVAYHMVRKAAEMGLKPFAVTSMAFRRAVSDRSAEGGKELIKAATVAQVLLLDDLGKGAGTETADEALLELLNTRRDRSRTTYFTMNGNGKWLAKKYGSDFGTAIAMRIASMCGHGSGEPLRIFKEKTGKE